jgi:hypothetical protein
LAEELVIYLAFLLAAISSVRHIPPWVIVCLPLIIKGFNTLEKEIAVIPQGLPRLHKTLQVFLVLSGIILITQTYLTARSGLNETSFYPVKAVSYLKANLPSGNIFADYGWGGYLIWKLPEKKVFIDGRMPSWRYTSCPAQESCNAMQDYIKLSTADPEYHQIFQKYQIDTVLMSAPHPLTPAERIELAMQNYLSSLLCKKTSTTLSLNDKLLQDGWHKVYEDQVSVILISPLK